MDSYEDESSYFPAAARWMMLGVKAAAESKGVEISNVQVSVRWIGCGREREIVLEFVYSKQQYKCNTTYPVEGLWSIRSWAHLLGFLQGFPILVHEGYYSETAPEERKLQAKDGVLCYTLTD